jgi:hypothetical protein
MLHGFTHMWNIDPIQIQKKLWKIGYTKEDHIGVREGKRRKLRRWKWLVYLLHKNEYGVFKTVKSP